MNLEFKLQGVDQGSLYSGQVLLLLLCSGEAHGSNFFPLRYVRGIFPQETPYETCNPCFNVNWNVRKLTAYRTDYQPGCKAQA